jgi:hypothetical protein
MPTKKRSNRKQNTRKRGGLNQTPVKIESYSDDIYLEMYYLATHRAGRLHNLGSIQDEIHGLTPIRQIIDENTPVDKVDIGNTIMKRIIFMDDVLNNPTKYKITSDELDKLKSTIHLSKVDLEKYKRP